MKSSSKGNLILISGLNNSFMKPYIKFPHPLEYTKISLAWKTFKIIENMKIHGVFGDFGIALYIVYKFHVHHAVKYIYIQ